MDRVLNKHAVLKNIDTVPYVAFSAFETYPELLCGFSTRLGGVSRGEFASMNLGFFRGDKEERVFENYRLLATSMGFLPEQLIFTDQVHETRLRQAGVSDCGKGIFRERDYKGVDGHATNEPGAALLVFGADCVPLFFYDPVNHAVAAAHAGWRGTVEKIAEKMVSFMEEKFGSNPRALRVVIGPSISPECYEVGQEVAAEFERAFGETVWRAPQEKGLENIDSNDGRKEADGWKSFPILTKKEGFTGGKNSEILQEEKGQTEKYLVNLWEANRQALLRANVAAEHITVSGLCTMCRQDLFFSHRASGGRRGSMAGFIMLKEV